MIAANRCELLLMLIFTLGAMAMIIVVFSDYFLDILKFRKEKILAELELSDLDISPRKVFIFGVDYS
ncbi:hypothetical protein L596_012320 [Steinernema carpocapsae]|uniref:Uncharacterized protein n=1 Tax=Steinernema carpocapsae TaxID=34508 RepID=A0A4U5NXI3_STECR|nr:hypothetical protein L596_012320 [Steinernema carpocapsae]